MKDIVNSFKAHLYERTSSPLIGAFIFYWFICNYKLVMVILDGDMKINEKFNLIKTLYPQNIWTPWEGFDIYYSSLLGNGLLMPLLITLAYIFIIPYPAKFIYQFWKTKQKEIQEIKQKIDDETPLTREQSKKIRQDFINLEIEHENIFKRKDEEIQQLKEMIKIKEEESTKISNEHSLKEDIKENVTSLNQEQVKLLTLISNYSIPLLYDKILKFTQIKDVTCRYYLDDMVEKGFIYHVDNDHYELSPNGRKYLVQNNLI